jgi:photosystem II stability/assembly factor-like uncharacterized protein
MRPESNVRVQHLALDPAIDGRIYAGTSLGVYMSVDRGESWYTTSFRDGVRGCLAADPKHAGRVFACSERELRRSDDGGRTWSPLTAPVAYLGGALVIDPVNSMILLGVPGQAWFRSQDAGSTWRPLLEAEASESHVVIDSVSGRYLAAVPYPGERPRCIIFESTNGGRSWNDLPDLEQAVFSLAVGAERRMLFAATDRGVFELHLSRRAKVRKR